MGLLSFLFFKYKLSTLAVPTEIIAKGMWLIRFVSVSHFQNLDTNYTCQLFVRYKRETFPPGVRGISEEDTIISEDSRTSMKSSEEFRSLPKTSEVFRRRLNS